MKYSTSVRNSRLETILYALGSILLLIVVWGLSVRYTALRKIMPSPTVVMTAIANAMVEPIGTHILPMHILYSLRRVFIGYLLAVSIGIPIGIIMGCTKRGEAIIRPIFELLRPIPGLAWIPLAILWFGIGENSKYFIICISASVSIILNTYEGAKSVDPMLVGAARMLGASERHIFVLITLPGSVPHIFAGLQVGLSSSWMAVIAAEMIRSGEGTGWIIITGMESGDTVQILVGMVSIGVVGLVLATLLRNLERRLCSWNIQGK